MLLKIDSNRGEALEVNVLDINRRRFEDDLKLQVLVQPVGILAAAPVGERTARLRVRDAIRGRSEHAKESFGVHGPCPDFHIIRLLQYATLPRPKLRQFQNQILKRDLDSLLNFSFNFL